MKKLSYFTLVLFLLTTGCNTEISINKIPGNWNVIEFNSNTPDLSPTLIEEARNMVLTTQYYFSADSNFTIQSSVEEMNSLGKWEVNEANNELTLIHETGASNAEKYTISRLDNSTMIWSQTLGQLGSLELKLERKRY